MDWTFLDMLLFAVAACGIAVLVVTFPAAWRWRSVDVDAKAIQQQLEKANKAPDQSLSLLNPLGQILDRRTLEIQSLRDQLDALKTSAPATRLDLQTLAEGIARNAAADRRGSLFRDVALGFVFMVLGAILTEAIKLVTGSG